MNILTVTLNPALDKSASIDGLLPDHKLKCHSIKYQPGGGGINISRVLNTLDVKSDCIITSGGDTGTYLVNLLMEENIHPKVISTKGWTRENLAIIDNQTGLQYRFGMPGNELSKIEIDSIKKNIQKKIKNEDILVLSGSLAEKMTVNFYAQLVKMVSNKNVKIIVDTSGSALKSVLNENVYLAKPNQKELAQLAGKEFLSSTEQENFAMEIIKSQKAKYVVVSLGARGAFLASKDGIVYDSTPSVLVKSTIGAGDSMVAGLIYGIKNNFTPQKMLRWGIACGVATTMSEGTSLASKENIEKVLYLNKYKFQFQP